MMKHVDSRRSLPLAAVLVLLMTFALGSVTGAGIALWSRGPEHRPPPPRSGPFPLHELELTTEQQEEVDAVFERYHPELDAVFRSTFPQVEAINKRLEADLRKLFTKEQNAKLDSLKAKRPGRPPPPPHPPGSGPPPPHDRSPPGGMDGPPR